VAVFQSCPRTDAPSSPTSPTVAGRQAHWGEGVTADEMADYIWLRPEIEAEIKFAEWTASRLLRHAEFVAVREA
jgi:ATP-dependent DNA ligase